MEISNQFVVAHKFTVKVLLHLDQLANKSVVGKVITYVEHCLCNFDSKNGKVFLICTDI